MFDKSTAAAEVASAQGTLEQSLHNAGHCGDLNRVALAHVVLLRAFHPTLDVDKGVGPVHWASQELPLVVSVKDVGAICHLALVKPKGGELAYFRVHPVLHIEEVLRVS